ncbi:MAG: RNA polymerase sigma factor RpoH [Kiloniellales bacterium]
MSDATLTRDDNLFGYLEKVRGFPMLAEREERDLARRWRAERDPEALARLAGSHLRMVVKMAMDNRGYGLPVAELISEGNLGLMQALEKFDPERGFRLSTYARWWIRAAIQDYILRSWSLVKMGTTAAQKKLFFNLRKLKRQLHEVEEGELSPQTVAWIAEELGVPTQEVVHMNRRLSGPDHSLNARLREADEGEWLDWLVDETAPDQETLFAEREELVQRRRMLGAAIKQLDERERRILIERRLRENPITLEGLGRQYSISRERVRQIEVRAFEKVQKAMQMAARAAAQASLAASCP